MKALPALSGAAVLTLLLACGGGGGGSTPATNPTVDGEVHSVAVAGDQVLGAGTAYPLTTLLGVAPTGSTLHTEFLARRRLALAQAPVPTSNGALAAPALTYVPSLNLYSGGLQFSGHTATLSFFSDAAGTQPAGSATATLPTGLSNPLDPTSYSTYPAVVTLVLDITGGNVPCTGTIQITFKDGAGANTMTGTNTLTRTQVGFTLDLTLDDNLNAGGSITVTEGGATIQLTQVSGPPLGTLTANVSVSPYGWTGTGTLTLLSGAMAVNLTAGTTAGFSTTSAGNLDINNADGTQEIVFNPLAAGLTATRGTITASAGSGQSAGTGAAFATPLQVTVDDANGLPVSGAVVTFSAPASGAGGSFAGGVDTAITNASGIAVAPVFTANGTAGSYTVSATVAGMAAPAPADFTLTNTIVSTGTIYAYWGTPQTTSINTAFNAPLQVMVHDLAGKPVEGVTVAFAAPASGAGGTFKGGAVTAVSDATGIATSAIFSANGTQGSYTVTATVPGIAGFTGQLASFALSNVGSASYNAPFLYYPSGSPVAGPSLIINGTGLSVGFLNSYFTPMYWTSPGAQPQPVKPPAGSGGTGPAPIGLNDSGQMVGAGSIGTGSYPIVPLYWSSPAAVPVPLANPYSSNNTYAMSINSSGQIVGFTDASTGSTTIYLGLYWSSPTAQPTLLKGPANTTEAADFISSQGQILCAGLEPLINDLIAANYVWSGPTAQAALLAGTTGLPFAIPNSENASGTIAGFVSTGFFASDLPATWANTGAPAQLLALPAGMVCGSATGINASGVIVGNLYDAAGSNSGVGVAVIWRNGTATDLNTLIPAGGDLTLRSAAGITDQGWIYGGGVRQGGAMVEYLLVPNP